MAAQGRSWAVLNPATAEVLIFTLLFPWWWWGLLSEYIEWSVGFVVFIFLCYSTYCFKIHSNTKNFLAVSAHIQPQGELKIMNQPPRVLRINNLKMWNWSLLLWDVLKESSVGGFTLNWTYFHRGGREVGEQGDGNVTISSAYDVTLPQMPGTKDQGALC